MASRRASTTAIDSKAKGEPYQVYSEVVNTGKNLENTKRKIRWVIGLTDMNDEIEVVLKHSLVTGKKSVLENGREIVTASNFLATDFSHGWTSPTCGHFFRVEASISLTQDNYAFSVDGIPFYNMQKKPSALDYRPKSTNLGTSATAASNSDASSGRYAGDVSNYSTSAAQRYSSAATGATTNNNRASFQSPVEKKPALVSTNNNTFDPFANNGSSGAAFDPFGDNADPFQPGPTTTTPTKAPVDIFASSSSDPFGANNDPFSGSSTQTKKPVVAATPSATQSLFGTVESATPQSSFDPFSSSPAPSHSHDPFAPSPNPAQRDPFAVSAPPSRAADPFAAPPAAAPSHTTHNAQARHQQQQNTQDIFNFDAPTASATKPNRRASAIEIAQDFADLSFGNPVPPPAPTPVVMPQPAPLAPEPVKEAAPLDPWQTGLVDLDLSSKSASNRRQSTIANSGPTLDSLMGSNPVPQRRSSMTVGSMPPTQPSMMPVVPPTQNNAFSDPFAATASQQRPMSTGYMSGYSASTTPMGAPAMAPQNTRASFIMTNPNPQNVGGMPIQNNGRGVAAGPVPGYSNTTNMGYANPQQTNKSSLDSLDWKSFQ